MRKLNHQRFVYAFRGLVHTLKHERSFQIELLAAGLVQAYAAIVRLPFARWAVLTLVSAAVLALELINTSFEHLANLVEPRLASPVRAIKDTLAAAVLVLALAAVVLFLGSVLIP
jgi:undecaprenol kinase